MIKPRKIYKAVQAIEQHGSEIGKRIAYKHLKIILLQEIYAIRYHVYNCTTNAFVALHYLSIVGEYKSILSQIEMHERL